MDDRLRAVRTAMNGWLKDRSLSSYMHSLHSSFQSQTSHSQYPSQ